MKDIQDALQDLALHVAEKARDPDTAFPDALDAFGKLTVYYGLLLKNQGKIPPEEVEPTMADLLNDDQGDPDEEMSNGRSRRSSSIPDGADTRTIVTRGFVFPSSNGGA